MTHIKTPYLVAALVALAVVPSACGGRKARAAKHPTGATAQAAPAPEPQAPQCRVNGPAYAVPAPGPIASTTPAPPPPPTPPGGVPLTPATGVTPSRAK
ncbi:MAG: hypothetical protein JWM74_2778 [Myxococcaceae bacterium]|nr:hypothetical protein [Myxococcaceae bacterium]